MSCYVTQCAEESLDFISEVIRYLDTENRNRLLKLIPQDGFTNLEGGEQAQILDGIRKNSTDEAEIQFLFNLACRLLHQ